MFLQVSVILFTGDACSRECLLLGGCLLWRVPAPREVPIPGGLVPGGLVLVGFGPRGVLVLEGCLDEAPDNGYSCGRYASYWNAFLFELLFWMLRRATYTD